MLYSFYLKLIQIHACKENSLPLVNVNDIIVIVLKKWADLVPFADEQNTKT